MSNRSQYVVVRSLGLLAMVLWSGCAADETSVDLPALHDLTSAPVEIRRAAAAVVRIATASAFGTGAFISPNGRLMTNNHVLGATLCPVEGCFVQLSFEHQRGLPRQEARTVFALPEHVDVGLDLAILQTYDLPPASGGVKLDTPGFLQLESIEPSALIGKHVTIVGHPNGKLKKWSDGVVIGASGVWLECTNFILPGDSGSPVLDDRGVIVGLIHRASADADDLTRKSVNLSAFGTASAQLLQAMAAPLPSVVVSTLAESSADEVVWRHLAYLQGRRPNALVDGKQVSVLSLLGEACDRGLARADYTSPEELRAGLAACYGAESWIECRHDAPRVAEGVVCPDNRDAWRARFASRNQRQRELNGQLDLNALTFALAALEDDEERGRQAGAASLSSALETVQPIRDFRLAQYLGAFRLSLPETARSIERYADVPFYERYASFIASAALWLGDARALDGVQIRKILRGLEADQDVGLGARLYIEEVRYNSGDL